MLGVMGGPPVRRRVEMLDTTKGDQAETRLPTIKALMAAAIGAPA